MKDFYTVIITKKPSTVNDHLLGEIAYANLGGEPLLSLPNRSGLAATLIDLRASLVDISKNAIIIFNPKDDLSAEMLAALAEAHEGSDAVLTLGTKALEQTDAAKDQELLICHDEWGEITSLTPGELADGETSGESFAGVLVVDLGWLWSTIDSAMGLPELVQAALNSGYHVISSPLEATLV